MRTLAVIVAGFAIFGVALAAAHVLGPSEPEPVQPIQLRTRPDSSPVAPNAPRSNPKQRSQGRRERASEQAAATRRPARPWSVAPSPRSTRARPQPGTLVPATGGEGRQEEAEEQEPGARQRGGDGVDDDAPDADNAGVDDGADSGDDE